MFSLARVMIIPICALLGGLVLERQAAAQTPPPVEMRLLVLAGDGSEPSYQAIRFFLDHMGIPYDGVALYDRTTAALKPLPTLATNSQGFYQGIILATSELAYQDASGGWSAALTPAYQAAIEGYMRSHKVRVLSYYTFPAAQYGMAFRSAVLTTEAQPALMTVTAAGVPLFPYLTRLDPVRVAGAYAYTATAVQAAGESTRPILTWNGGVMGVLHTKADGREYLALTMDNNPYLQHSMLLNYGLINWVTKGVFLGYRKIFLTPQSDDLFLASSLFVTSDPYCQGECPSLRINGLDLARIAQWQDGWTARAQTRQFKVTMAYNGEGAVTESGAVSNDPLTVMARALASKFFWVNHTYDHANLDCFAQEANGACRPATYAESVYEIAQNVAVANKLRLALDRPSMVTPEISGLYNPEFLRAAADQGIRHLVSEMSRGDFLPVRPNEGVYNPLRPSILLIPRRPTGIFYNAASGRTGVAGSEPDEYNFLYGPNGLWPSFSTTQTYAQIVERESNTLLSYMLRYEMYPSMFHQANFWRYEGNKSLFVDVIDLTLRKFTRLQNLPVISLAQSALGQLLADRMTYNTAGVRATIVPGVNITLTAARTARVPVTGVCRTGCESYGGQAISTIPVPAGQAVVVPLR